jgi:hemerythrin-like domain-containing protein
LDIVDGMIKKLEDGERIEIVDVTTILKFLRLFGDQYHQAMEENILFPTLLRRAPDETALRQFVCEHGDERILVVQIEDALISRRGMAVFRSLRQLTALLRHHCDTEEAILGDLTEHCLSRDEDDEVVAEFIKVRRQVEIYTNFSRLELKYPGKPLKDQAFRAAERRVAQLPS